MVRNDQQRLKFFVDTEVVGTTSMFDEASKLDSAHWDTIPSSN